MALTKLVKINDNSFWAAWKIEESLLQLFDLLQFPEAEIHKMELTIHHPKKKLEWTAGRLALQALLTHLHLPEWKLAKDPFGKPHLLNHKIQISLANSFPFATSIIHRNQSVGIDIEHPTEKLLRVAHKFLNEHELGLANNNLNLLCIFWCAKECIYKIHGRKMLSFKEHMHIQTFNQNNITVQVRSPNFFATHHLNIECLSDFYVLYNL